MIVIVDNGKGSEEISQILRFKNEIVSPKEAMSEKPRAYILTDGSMKKDNHAACEKIIKMAKEPVLGIGLGAAIIAASYGAKIRGVKTKQSEERIVLKKPCPLLLDLKRNFVAVKSSSYTIDALPENFTEVASSKAGAEAFMEVVQPHFGVQFNPELGCDGQLVLNNFAKLVEIWEKYHR